MVEIVIEVHLYGELSQYADEKSGYGSADLHIKLEENSTVRDVLARLKIPSERRGITFINGNLSAMPGLQPDLDHILNDGDRVAFFDLKSMWPFQYRSGAAMTVELKQALSGEKDLGIHHSYE